MRVKRVILEYAPGLTAPDVVIPLPSDASLSKLKFMIGTDIIDAG
jgi:hypothetical protein